MSDDAKYLQDQINTLQIKTAAVDTKLDQYSKEQALMSQKLDRLHIRLDTVPTVEQFQEMIDDAGRRKIVDGLKHVLTFLITIGGTITVAWLADLLHLGDK